MNDLVRIYQLLLKRYGKQNWWPADSKDEMIIGAILTQNTSWSNVDRALANLKERKLNSLNKLAIAPVEEIATLIRPAGYYNVKSGRLKNVAAVLSDWQPDGLSLEEARRFLLTIKGIGNETADSILLYAFNLPLFVIDAYTVRLFSRLDKFPPDRDYRFYQNYFSERLRPDPVLFNEYHALIVRQGKIHCKVRAVCTDCPLTKICPSRS